MNEILKIVHNEQANREIQFRKKAEERIEKENREETESQERSRINKEMLDNLGIEKLFYEIIGKGLLRYIDFPVEEEIPIYKKKFFGGEVLDHMEWIKKSDYTPALILYGHENSSISLCFNYWKNKSGDDETSGCETITAVVTPLKAVSLEVINYDGTNVHGIKNEIPLNRENLGQVIGAEVAKHI